jgi:hypothetical protein
MKAIKIEGEYREYMVTIDAPAPIMEVATYITGLYGKAIDTPVDCADITGDLYPAGYMAFHGGIGPKPFFPDFLIRGSGIKPASRFRLQVHTGTKEQMGKLVALIEEMNK